MFVLLKRAANSSDALQGANLVLVRTLLPDARRRVIVISCTKVTCKSTERSISRG